MTTKVKQAFEAGQRVAKSEQGGESPSYEAVNPYERHSPSQADAWSDGYFNPDLDYSER